MAQLKQLIAGVLVLCSVTTGTYATNCSYNAGQPEYPLWIIAGQSNAAGLARLTETSPFYGTDVYDRVKIWGIKDNLGYSGITPSQYDSGNDDGPGGIVDNLYLYFDWAYRASLTKWQNVQPGYGVKFQDAIDAMPGATHEEMFGPELEFGRLLHNFHSTYGSRSYIVKLAIAATDLADDWAYSTNPDSLFQQLAEMVAEATNASAYNPKLRGIMWIQGESDALVFSNANNYASNLGDWVNDLVTELEGRNCEMGIDPPLLNIVRLNRNSPFPYINTVRQKQDAIEQFPTSYGLSNYKVGIVDTEGLTFRNEALLDGHYNTGSMIYIGNRLYNALNLFNSGMYKSSKFRRASSTYTTNKYYFNGANYCEYASSCGSLTIPTLEVYIPYDKQFTGTCSHCFVW